MNFISVELYLHHDRGSYIWHDEPVLGRYKVHTKKGQDITRNVSETPESNSAYHAII
jgi:hypothetical protein